MLTFLAAASLSCVPVAHDGDTFRCGAERIRIMHIDAPELPGSPSCEPAGRANHWCDDPARATQARDALTVMLARGHVRVYRHGRDRYGRTLAVVTANGVNVASALIRQGLAVKRW